MPILMPLPIEQASNPSRRLHRLLDSNACTQCGFYVLNPVFRVGDEPISDERPNATRDYALWLSWPFNCERVPAPAGKPAPKLTGNGV